MKNQIYFTILVIILITGTNAFGQVSNGTNTSTANPEFLGWNNGVSKDLDIRNNFSEHINLFTNSEHRIKLNPDVTYTVNGHNAARNGYMLLGNSTVFIS